MSFFDKIGGKLSETGSDIGKIVSETTQRAKESSRAVSLKKQIREEEGKINQMCLYIMRLYLRDAKEEEFPYPDMLRMVRESEQKIANYYQEIEILQMERPTMASQGNLGNMGQQPEEAAQEKETGEMAVCPACGAALSGGAFCGQCGTRIK